MNWSHSSELGLIAAAFVLVVTAGVAGAVVPTPTDVPDEAEVGEQIVVEVELTDLYADDAQWHLGGETGLENAEWTVESYSDGELVDRTTASGSELQPPVEIDESATDAPDTVIVTVEGEVPAVDSYSYADGEQFQGVALAGHDGESRFEIGSWSVGQYTTGDPGSKEARTALDDARTAIDDAEADGQDVSDAEATWNDGVAAFDSGSFGEAVSLADEAQSQLEPTSTGSQDDSSTDDGSTDDSSSDDETNDSASDGTGADDGGADASDADTDDGGIGFLTVLGYVLGLAVVVGVIGGALYVTQQRQGPGGRDPLG